MMKYITPTLTALKSKTEIDVQSCLKHYDFLINAGIDGVAIFGSSGEFPHLAVEERKSLISAAIKHIDRRMQVLIGTGDMRVEECVAMSNFAFEQGADGVMVVGPWYFALTDADVMSYFGAVAEQVRGKVYIYNYPDRTGYTISPSVVLELARRYPNIVGIKDTIPDMAHTVELIQTVKGNLPSFEVLSGFDHNFASNVLAGGDGCIAAVSNVRPDLCVAWRDAMKARDFDGTMKYQQLFNRIMGVYGFSSPFMAAMKGLLVDAGIFASAAVASPYQEATSAQMFAVREFMRGF